MYNEIWSHLFPSSPSNSPHIPRGMPLSQLHVILKITYWVQLLLPMWAWVRGWDFLLLSHQLPKVPELGMDSLTIPPPSILEFWLAWSCGGLVHTVTSAVRLCGNDSVTSGKHYSTAVLHYLWLLESFHLFCKVYSSSRRNLMETSHLGLSVLRSLIVCT